MPTIWTFDDIENKHDVYRGEDYMKTFHESLRENATKIVNFEKKKMIPLTNDESIFISYRINCYTCKECMNINKLMIKTIAKLVTTATIHVDNEVYLACVNLNIVYLTKFLSFFKMDLTMITILS